MVRESHTQGLPPKEREAVAVQVMGGECSRPRETDVGVVSVFKGRSGGQCSRRGGNKDQSRKRQRTLGHCGGFGFSAE